MSYPLVSMMPHRSDRHFLPLFVTEYGAVLRDVGIAYETYGTLNRYGNNAILVCHALTGDARAADGQAGPGWWGPLIGSGRALDTDQHFVVCMNVLGGCAGSTGPASTAPGTRDVYGSSFPVITIRDMVEAQFAVLQGLGVTRLRAVVGGSMGGMQALEWAVMHPEFVEAVAVLAAAPLFSTMAIAYNEVMREAIVSDPHYHDGEYARFGVVPESGLRIARMLGMITYRTAQLFAERFGREWADEDACEFQVGRYLRHQGNKLVHRFDANSYLTLLRAMDLHDLSRGRGSIQEAYAGVSARVLFVGIDDDRLFPPEELRQATDEARQCGVTAIYEHVTSRYGHDAFLLEFEQLDEILRRLLRS